MAMIACPRARWGRRAPLSWNTHRATRHARARRRRSLCIHESSRRWSDGVDAELVCHFVHSLPQPTELCAAQLTHQLSYAALRCCDRAAVSRFRRDTESVNETDESPTRASLPRLSLLPKRPWDDPLLWNWWVQGLQGPLAYLFAADHAASLARVHQALPAARAPQGLPPHPPLRAICLHQPRPEYRDGPCAPRCRPACRRSPTTAGCCAACHACAAVPMPVLWRAHDRHRGVRTPPRVGQNPPGMVT